MPEISCTAVIFVKKKKTKRKLHHKITDLERAFDRAPRKAIEWALRRQGIPERLVRLVKCMYKDLKIKVCAPGWNSELFFHIKIEVHLGSTLGPLLSVFISEKKCQNKFGEDVCGKCFTLMTSYKLGR